MPFFSQSAGILDGTHIAALRQIIADVCIEEGYGENDLAIRKVMADALMGASAGANGTMVDIHAMKEVARAASRQLLAQRSAGWEGHVEGIQQPEA